jgi:hypothetical protein
MARTAVVAGTATAVSNRVSRRQGERWQAKAQQEAAQAAPAPAPPPPAPAPAAPGPPARDAVSQLKDLADLRSQGILTDEEFAAQKAKILAS